MNASTGAVSWVQTWPGYNTLPVLDAAGRVYVAAGSSLRAYNAESGALLWTSQSGVGQGVICGAPAVSPDGARVYVPSSAQNFLYAYSTASGSLVWRSQPLGAAVSMLGGIAVGPDGALYASAWRCGASCAASRGSLYKLSGATGAVLWNFTTPPGVFSMCRPAVGPNGQVVVSWAGSNPWLANTTVVDGASGRLLWSTVHSTWNEDPRTAPIIDSQDVVFVFGGFQAGSPSLIAPLVRAFNLTTGVQLWSVAVSGPISSAAAIGLGGTLLVGTSCAASTSAGAAPHMCAGGNLAPSARAPCLPSRRPLRNSHTLGVTNRHAHPLRGRLRLRHAQRLAHAIAYGQRHAIWQRNALGYRHQHDLVHGHRHALGHAHGVRRCVRRAPRGAAAAVAPR